MTPAGTGQVTSGQTEESSMYDTQDGKMHIPKGQTLKLGLKIYNKGNP